MSKDNREFAGMIAAFIRARWAGSDPGPLLYEILEGLDRAADGKEDPRSLALHAMQKARDVEAKAEQERLDATKKEVEAAKKRLAATEKLAAKQKTAQERPSRAPRSLI